MIIDAELGLKFVYEGLKFLGLASFDQIPDYLIGIISKS